MNRILKNCLLIAALFVLLAVSVSAAGKTVYVGGEEAGAYSTLADAVKALDGEGGTVVLCKAVNVNTSLTIPEQSGDLCITADGGSLIIGASITLAKNTNDNTVIFDCPIMVGAKGKLYGGFNSVTFTENCTMDGKLDFFGGVATAEGPTDGIISASDKDNLACIATLPYTITVENGSFGIFEGGNERPTYTTILGSIAAPITINILGGTFGNTVSYGANDPLKLDCAISISGMSILASDATLNISGGTFYAPIYAQGYVGNTCTRTSGGSQITKSSADYYAADGEIIINITGGRFNGCEISAEQTGPTYNQVLRGNFTLNIGEDAALADGMVLDATQVKAYPGSDALATLTYPAGANVTVKRFDLVNGTAETYEEPIRIACVGDSITQGTGSVDFEHYSYPAQLLQKIAAEGTDVVVSNYGCGATKVMNYSGLWYNDMLAYTLSMEECDAKYVVVGLGTNDAATSRYCVGQTEHFREMYTDFMLGYEALPNTEMVYGTSALYRVGTALAATAVTRGTQENVQRELAEAGYKVTYVDLYALLLDDCLAGKVLASDNLHPNAGGYTLYKDVVYNAIFNGVTEVENFELKDIWVSASGSLTGAGTQADPINDIAMALSKAADEATIHIVGTVVYDKLGEYVAFTTPVNVKKLTFVGEGSGATLSVNTKLFNIYSDMEFDNLTLRYSGSTTLYISCNYHNVTFTETFKTTGATGAVLVGGCLAFNGNEAAAWYNSVEAISSAEDCVIDVRGGGYYYIIGGNRQWTSTGSAGDALYGIYSGSMTLNIGSGVNVYTTRDIYRMYNAAVGQNYLTGSVTVNLDKNLPFFNAYSIAGEYDTTRAKHNEGMNTGTVTINLGEGVTTGIPVVGDFNGDGEVDLNDAILMIRYTLQGFDAEKAANFYYKTDISLVNVIRALKKLAN